jgi:NAD(P)-dependent dehydrogenase (short-subunit alcohol dehydrogenase family)
VTEFNGKIASRNAGHRTDVSDEASVRALFEAVGPELHILVNCAASSCTRGAAAPGVGWVLTMWPACRRPARSS